MKARLPKFALYKIHAHKIQCPLWHKGLQGGRGQQLEPSYGKWLATQMHENIEVKRESKEGGLLL